MKITIEIKFIKQLKKNKIIINILILFLIKINYDKIS